MTVLIDPGHSRHVERLFHQMEEDGISSKKIDLVIITHSHPDHFEGLKAFTDTPVKIAMSRAEEVPTFGQP
jgi:glyoxylase-like metal-dependent hydrolase (beta-lactamase superfamily II)